MTFIRSIHPDLSQTESQIERIASKTPVIQIVIVTLHPQMTSALCLCRFQQPQALRSFPLRYLSNAYDRVTSSFSEGYLLIIFSRTIFNDVRNVIMTTSGTVFHHVPKGIKYPEERPQNAPHCEALAYGPAKKPRIFRLSLRVSPSKARIFRSSLLVFSSHSPHA